MDKYSDGESDTRRKLRMKDVRWGDILLAVILMPILVLPVFGAVYLIFFVLLGFSTDALPDWMSLIIMATCAVEGFIFVRLYEGEGEAIEHGWAWLAAIVVIAAVALVPYAAGVLSAEAAFDLVEMLYADLAMIFLIAMLAVFFNTRRKRAGSLQDRRIDVERYRGLWLLRK